MNTSPSTQPSRPLLTPAEHQRYRAELERLHLARDREMPGLLRDARGLVASDAAEEILQLQGDFSVADARIAQLEALLGEASVVDGDDAAAGVAALGRSVTVQYTGSGRLATFHLGWTAAASPETRVVSARSPVGRALLGRSCGDVVAVELPSDRVEEMRILSVGLPAGPAS